MLTLAVTVTGLVIGECVEFGGFPTTKGEVGDVSGKEIDDSEGGAVFVVLEGERVCYS